MIPVSNDFYAGMVPPGAVREYHVLFFDGLGFWTLANWSGQISAFPLLHVDIWLSLNQPMGKAGVGVFGHVKTGNSGRGSRGMDNLELLFNPGDSVWLNAWAHNMKRTSYDWHCSYELWLM